MVIEIPETLANRLRTRAEITGESINTFTTAWLADTLAADEAEAIDGIRDGLEDVAAGREEPLSDSLAEMLNLLDKRTAVNASIAE